LVAVVHVVVPHLQALSAGVFWLLPSVLEQSGTSEQLPAAPQILAAAHFSTKASVASLQLQAPAL
jgi:hypothetical protein